MSRDMRGFQTESDSYSNHRVARGTAIAVLAEEPVVEILQNLGWQLAVARVKGLDW